MWYNNASNKRVWSINERQNEQGRGLSDGLAVSFQGGKRGLIERILEDPELREDVLDMALIREREGEPSISFEDYQAGKRLSLTCSC